MKSEMTLRDKKINKFKEYYNLSNRWLSLKMNGRALNEYFKKNHYKKIAIYGVGELGKRLVEEMVGTSIEITYALDKDAGGDILGIPVLDCEDDLNEVDVIVVTPIFDFDSICEKLGKHTNMKIISLTDVIYSV